MLQHTKWEGLGLLARTGTPRPAPAELRRGPAPPGEQAWGQDRVCRPPQPPALLRPSGWSLLPRPASAGLLLVRLKTCSENLLPSQLSRVS